jgi:hypothetical protein
MLQNSLLQNVNYKIEYFEQYASVLIPRLQVKFQFKNFQQKLLFDIRKSTFLIL